MSLEASGRIRWGLAGLGLVLPILISVSPIRADAESFLELRARVNHRALPLLERYCRKAQGTAVYAYKQIDHALAMGEPQPIQLLYIAAGRYFDCSDDESIPQSARDWATLRYCEVLFSWSLDVWEKRPVGGSTETLEQKKQANSEFQKHLFQLEIALSELAAGANDVDLKNIAAFEERNDIKRYEDVVEKAQEQDAKMSVGIPN